eukprot:13628863-Alexandrium_andersonii.AAC.1
MQGALYSPRKCTCAVRGALSFTVGPGTEVLAYVGWRLKLFAHNAEQEERGHAQACNRSAALRSAIC